MNEEKEQAEDGDEVCYSDDIPHLLSGNVGVKTNKYFIILALQFGECKDLLSNLLFHKNLVHF